MDPVGDVLCSIYQDGSNIESYVEEFVQYCYLTTLKDWNLMDLFWSGLDNHIPPWIPVGNPTLTLKQYLDWVLWVCGSPYIVGEVCEVENNHATKQQFSCSQYIPMWQFTSPSPNPVSITKTKPRSSHAKSDKHNSEKAVPVSNSLASKLEDLPIMSVRMARKPSSVVLSLPSSNKEPLTRSMQTLESAPAP